MTSISNQQVEMAMNDNYEEKHLFCIYLNSQCAATENIYTPPHRRNLNLSGVGGGGWVLDKTPSLGMYGYFLELQMQASCFHI